MSKIIKQLKYAAALKKKHAQFQEEKSSRPDNKAAQSPDMISLNKQTLFGILASFIVIVLVTQCINIAFFTNIYKKRELTEKLVYNIINTEKKINTLEQNIQLSRNRNKDSMNEINKTIKRNDRLVLNNQRELIEMAIESNTLRVELRDLQGTHNELMNNYIDLTDELNKMKKAKSL